MSKKKQKNKNKPKTHENVEKSKILEKLRSTGGGMELWETILFPLEAVKSCSQEMLL